MTRQELKEFYEEHSRRLFSISLRIVGDAGEAEEIMHDALLKYLSADKQIPAGVQTAAWLNRTCIRASIDSVRRRSRQVIDSEDYLNVEDEEPESGLEEFQAAQLRAGISALDEPYRMTLTLVLIEGLDYEEIAQYTNDKEATVRSRYSRGRAKLIKMLKNGK